MAIIGSAEVNIRAITDRLEDDIQRALGRIADKIDIQINADTTQLEAQISEVIDSLETTVLEIEPIINTDAAQAHIDQFVQDNAGTSIAFNANPFTKYASARLSYLARPRLVEYIATINEAAFAQTATTLASLSGGKYVVDRLRNINKYLLDIGSHVPRLALMNTALFGVAGAVSALGSNLLTLAGSLASIVPAALALPGIFAGFAVGLGATYVVMKDFKTELADLGPQFTLLQDEMSGDFWARFEGPMRSLVDSLFPQFRDSMRQISESLGTFFAMMAISAEQFVTPGVLKEMMDNLDESIQIATGAIYPLTEAFTILGQIGSSYLPRLAQWFDDISLQFRNFIAESAESGALQEWIDNGIEALKDLGRVIGEASEIFYDLYTAAEAAGGANLDTLANALERISEITGSPAFQTALIQVFRGGHAAMDGMMSALGPLGDMFIKLGPEIEESLGLAGRIIGELATHIATALSNPVFQQGLTDFFSGIYVGVQALGPAMAPLGEVFGTLGTFVGELARNLGPVITAAVTALAPAFTEVMNAIMPLLPMLSGALIGAIESLTPGIILLAQNFADFVPVIIGAATGILNFVSSISTAAGPALPTIIVGLIGIVGAATKIAPAVGFAFDAFDKLRDVRETIQAVFAALSNLSIGARLAGVAANVFRGIMLAVNIVMRANPIGLIITGLTLLVGGLILAYNKVGWFKDFVNGAFEAIKGAVQGVVDFWNNTLIPIFDGLGPAISGMWTSVTTFFSEAITNITNIWNGFWNGLGAIVGTVATTITTSVAAFFAPLIANWNMVWTAVSTTFTNVWNGLITFLMPILIPLGNLITTTVQGIRIMWEATWLAIRLAFDAVWNGLVAFFTPILTTIQVAISTALTAIQTVWNIIWTGVSTTFTNIWNTIIAFITPIVSTIQAVISGFVLGVQAVWNTVWGAIGSYLSSIWTGIITAVNVAVTAVRTYVSAGITAVQVIWTNIWNTIRAVVAGVWAAISAVVSGAINNVRNTISSVVSTIQALWSGGWNAIRNAAAVAVQMIISNIASFVTNIRDNIANAITIVTGLRDRIVNALAGAGQWLVSVGTDMIGGLIRGIQGAIGGVIDAARNLASSAVDTVMGILKINSPSKVFIGIGDSINEGLADGINHSSGTMAAMAGVASSLSDVAASAIASTDFNMPVAKFTSMGEQIGNGLAKGIQTSVAAVSAATASLSDAAVPTLVSVTPGASQVQVPSRAVNTSTPTNGVPLTASEYYSRNGATEQLSPIQVIVNPSTGLDETAIGEQAAETLYWNLMSR